MSEVALQIAEERKGKLYPTESESQRKGRSDKKVFLNEQCKEIEENDRMGKTTEISSRKLEILREHFMQRWSR